MNGEQRVETSGGSWALQGCLFGSVALFVVLLLILLFLGYRQFREHTEQPAPTPVTGSATIEDWLAVPVGPEGRAAPAAAPRWLSGAAWTGHA